MPENIDKGDDPAVEGDAEPIVKEAALEGTTADVQGKPARRERTPEYIAFVAAREKKNRQTMLLRRGAVVAGAIGVPLIYLIATGALSPGRVKQSLRGGTKINDQVRAAAPTPPPLSTKGDPIREDLRHYVSIGLPSIAPAERRALDDFNQIVKASPPTDPETQRIIRDRVLPEYERYVMAASALKPQTPEVQKIHRLFMQCAQNKLEVFRYMTEGDGLRDLAQRTKAANISKLATTKNNEFQEAAIRLATDHGVALPTKY